MKKLFFIALMFISMFGYSQKIEFKALTYNKSRVCDNCIHEYTPLKTPINVSLINNSLYMIYENGKELLKADVLRIINKQDIKQGELKADYYILEISKDDFYQYITIDKTYDMGEIIYSIKVPRLSNLGEIYGFTEYYDF